MRRKCESTVLDAGRRGSVLILVVVLLVLLALVGTVFLSTSSTERRSSQQYTVNTEADVLLQGLITTLNGSIAVDACARYSAGGTLIYPQTYRLGWQEMAYPPPSAGGGSGLGEVDGCGTFTAGPTGSAVPHDLFLAERIPTLTDSATNAGAAGDIPVNWAAVSWPLFADPAGNYVFDSPFEGPTEFPVNTFGFANRSQLRFFPATKTENGRSYPGLLVYLPPDKSIVDPAGNAVMSGPGFLTPSPSAVGGFQSRPLAGSVTSPQYNSYTVFAADTDGDGIADAPLWKMPIGPLNGVTYYAAIRVVDNNAAFNASTAWDNQTDTGSALSVGGTTYNAAYLASQGLPASYLNYGFFRSNIGLLQALNPSPVGTSAPTVNQEMTALNEYRIAGAIASPATAPAVTLNLGAYDDQMNLRADFTFASAGDLIDSQLARRGDNPGYANSSAGLLRMNWLSCSDTAFLSRRFCLADPDLSPSLLEVLLPNELARGSSSSTVRETPYSAGQLYSASGESGFWFNDQFASRTTATAPYSVYPPQLRSLLVGSNAQSNAIPSRFGNSGSVPLYDPNAVYAFGDLVHGSDGSTYVSLVSANNTAMLTASAALPLRAGSATLATNNPTDPPINPAIYENPFWARVSWSDLPVRASVNTASFEQLWMAFCQVMTDSISPPAASTAQQWNPPQTAPAAANSLDTYVAGDTERQLAMFRSSVRDNRASPGLGLVLSPMQQMQLRAGLAAVNTIDMRDGDDDVTSRHIMLDDSTGAPEYDVELFGTEKQPYILEVLADVQDDGTPAAEQNYLEIELVNPYPTPIIMTPSWHVAYITRSAARDGSASTMKLNDIGPLNSTVIIPPAQGNRPGLAYITSVTTATSPGSTIHTPTNLDPPVTTVIVQNADGSRSISASNVGTVSGLESALKGEIVILKPRLAATPDRLADTKNFPNGDRSISTDPTDRYDEVHSFADLVPVDQVDFTGALGVSNKTFPYRLHYRRAANPLAAKSYAWNFVYPGPYYAQATGTAAGSNGSSTSSTSAFDQNFTLRLAFQIERETANVANPDLGDFNDLPAGDPSTDVSTTPTYFTAPIQLNNVNMAGPNPTFTTAPPISNFPLTCTLPSVTKVNQFPFGGFARNGDLMQIPFIGAYRILPWHNPNSAPDSSAVVELNSVSMDSACAWDTTLAAHNAGISPGTSSVSIDGTTQSVHLNPLTGNWELPPEGATVNQPNVFPPSDAQSITATGAHFFEQIGRMCPVGDSGAAGPASDDFVEPSSTATAATQNWHYHWARRLFDYLTVDAPHDDYFPNVDPRPALATSTPVQGPRYPLSDPALAAVPAPLPVPVKNKETAGVEGLVNVNTAPLCVLAQVPFVPRGTDNITYLPATTAGSLGTVAASQGNPDDTNADPTSANPLTPRDDNTDLAQAIIDYRSVHGPFKSLIDLYKVPAFALENQLLWQNAKEPTTLQGYFIAGRPAYNSVGIQDWTKAGSDSPRYDFAERFLLLNHVSNLLTTRSDSFTCYLLLQGWRNVGTSNPTLAVQRRAAFLLDRTSVTAKNPTPNIFRVLTQ